MKQLEVKKSVVYRWWRTSRRDILPAHQSDLEAAAEEQISDSTKQGFISGELNACMLDGHNHDVDYTGWWEVKTA